MVYEHCFVGFHLQVVGKLFYLNNVEFVNSSSLLRTLSSGNHIRWILRIKLCKIVLNCFNNWDYSNRMSIAAHSYCLFLLVVVVCSASAYVLFSGGVGGSCSSWCALSLRYSFLILFSTPYPMIPHISETMQQLDGFQFATALDFNMGYS